MSLLGWRSRQYESIKDVSGGIDEKKIGEEKPEVSVFWKGQAKVVVFFVGIIIIVVLATKSVSGRKNYDVQQQQQQQQLYDYRTTCETIRGRNVRVIQTSLNDPSAHWTELPCQAHKSVSQHERDSGFRFPSALIKSDFSSFPFQHRPSILGFGGAFTEAAALNYHSLNDAGREAVLELLFGPSGLGYTLGRVHINSCDFSLASYDFDSLDQDFNLTSFDTHVTHDVTSGMIQLMTEANLFLTKDGGWTQLDHVDAHNTHSDNDHEITRGLRIVASPWSPPKWMKSPTPQDSSGVEHAQTMLGSHQPSCLIDGTGPNSQYAKAWALYLTKFISAYKHLGIDLWAITVQNEPEFPAPWEACSYTPSVQSDFISYHLGPIMRETHPDVKIFIFDHNKDHAPIWANTIIPSTSSTAAVSPFVDGVAVHWYASGNNRLLDGAMGAPNMHRLMHDITTITSAANSKQQLILGTESCHCPSTGYASGDLNVAWYRAERYAHTILADLSSGSNGWMEWNLLLDSVGGPNHLGNMCDSPLLAVPHRAIRASVEGIPSQMNWETIGHPYGRVVGDGRTREELHALGAPAKFLDLGVVVQPMYYYMGHISRHVRPGSQPVRAIVDSSTNKGAGGHAVSARTFRALDGESIVAGGGINNLAASGVEVTTWPCEGSTRQEWKLVNNSKSRAGGAQLQVYGHDSYGIPTMACLSSHIDPSYQGLLLTECSTKNGDPGYFIMNSYDDNNNKSKYGDPVEIVVAGQDIDPSLSCLIVMPLDNNGGANGERGGAQVSIGDCRKSSAKWTFSDASGEISSHFFAEGEVCLTTGWPFLQIGAFQNVGGSKTAVILNEADQAANYMLDDVNTVILTGSIPAHSIQTVTFD